MSLIHFEFNREFVAGFFHYQIYWFFLPLIAVGSGAWQDRAMYYFFAGSLFAASLFYLNSMNWLPENTLFRSYVVYEGNKSILLGLLLALAAGWMLHDWRLKKNFHLWRAVGFLYVVIALVFCSKSRTASILFFLLFSCMVLRNFQFKRLQIFILVCGLSGTGLACYYASQMPTPVSCSVKEMKDVNKMNGAQIIFNRAICTVQQIRHFEKTQQVSADGMRLELYWLTWEMSLEKPLLGHGIGRWLPDYTEKARGRISEKETTPHNDYLLYFFELGIAGPLALLLFFVVQFRSAKQMRDSDHRHRAMLLVMLTLTMAFSAIFNAILRDAVFGLAMLILLAIPMAGIETKRVRSI